MDDLVAWLTQILSTQEKAAQRVVDRYAPDEAEIYLDDPWPEEAAYLPHIKPAVLLAKISADRKILAWCTERDRIYVGGYGRSDKSDPKNYVPGSLTHPADSVVIRLMAEAYDDRPGYREEWRP